MKQVKISLYPAYDPSDYEGKGAHADRYAGYDNNAILDIVADLVNTGEYDGLYSAYSAMGVKRDRRARDIADALKAAGVKHTHERDDRAKLKGADATHNLIELDAAEAGNIEFVLVTTAPEAEAKTDKAKVNGKSEKTEETGDAP